MENITLKPVGEVDMKYRPLIASIRQQIKAKKPFEVRDL